MNEQKGKPKATQQIQLQIKALFDEYLMRSK